MLVTVFLKSRGCHLRLDPLSIAMWFWYLLHSHKNNINRLGTIKEGKMSNRTLPKAIVQKQLATPQD